jgi:hypothetical protein
VERSGAERVFFKERARSSPLRPKGEEEGKKGERGAKQQPALRMVLKTAKPNIKKKKIKIIIFKHKRNLFHFFSCYLLLANRGYL